MTGHIADELMMLALGKRMGQIERPTGQGMVVFLRGDLGTGKTTLVRGFLRGLGYEGTVKSPTYTLVEPYQLGDVNAYHIDLYRLSDPRELEFTGLRDNFGEPALFFVEWPERARPALPNPDLEVSIRRVDQGRQVTFQAASATGRQLLPALGGE